MTEREMLTRARVYVNVWADKQAKVYGDEFDTMYLDYIDSVGIYNFSKAKEAFANGQKHKPLAPLVRNVLESAFSEYLRLLPNIYREQIKEKLKCEQENLEPLKTWVKAVTGSVKDDDLYIMAHWLWLVKRNAASLPVVWHIMPIVTSAKQGGGKSTAVQQLIKPVNDLMLELQVPQVVDERSFAMFTNYLVGFFDEMAGAEKVEMATFKRNVTSSTLTYRPMRTNTQVKISNRCSFIGATNNNIFEIIKDTTGIRRFFPIDASDQLDQTTLNNLDYLALWKGVDERLERGYFERVQERVAIKQDSLTIKDEVAVFLEDYHIMPTGETVVVSGKELYSEYIVHAANSGIRFTVSRQVFYKKLQATGLKWFRKADINKVLTYFFEISPQHAVYKGGLNGFRAVL